MLSGGQRQVRLKFHNNVKCYEHSFSHATDYVTAYSHCPRYYF